MTEWKKTEELTAEELGGEIRLLLRQARQMALECGIQVGYRLWLAKEKVGEGFAGWVERETDISKSSAYRFIQLYKEYGSEQGSLLGVENVFPTLGNVSVSNALRLIAIPEEEREEFAREVDAEHISARELGEAIRERDAARKRAETAEKELAEKAAALDDQITKREDAEDAAQRLEALLREAEKRPTELAIDETAVQKAAEEARKAAEAEGEKEIDKLKKALEAAEDARKSAEAAAKKESAAAAEKAAETARAAQAEAEALRKKLRTAESGASEAILLVRLAQENFNLAVEKLQALKNNDAETANKLLLGTKKILETLIGRCA